MKRSEADYDRASLDIRDGRIYLRALHRRSDSIEGRLNGGVLRCGWQCASDSKRHGDSRRLDERRIVHLHGGAYLVHGTRRFRLSDGLDWWLRVTSVAAGAIPAKVWEIYRAGLCGR